MLFRLSRLIPALAMASCLAAQATTHVVQMQLDAGRLQPGVLSGGPDNAGVRLSTGDVLSVEISFLPGQRLQVQQPLSFALITAGRDLTAPIDLTLLNTLTLRGAGGEVLHEAAATQLVNGTALQSLFFANQLGLPMFGGVSLSGLSFTTTVQSYGDGASVHDFGAPQLSVVAGGMGSAVSVVPEPATLGLTLAGMLALCLWSARKRLGVLRG